MSQYLPDAKKRTGSITPHALLIVRATRSASATEEDAQDDQNDDDDDNRVQHFRLLVGLHNAQSVPLTVPEGT